MSDTAPHFIDSAATDTKDALNTASGATQQTVTATKDNLDALADKTATAASRGAELVRDSSARAYSTLTEVNKTVTEAVGQALSEMNALAQQAVRIRTPQDFVAYQSQTLSYFQNNLTALGNIYSVLWRNTTASVSAFAGKGEDTTNSLRSAA